MAHGSGFGNQRDGAFSTMSPSELIFSFLLILLAGWAMVALYTRRAESDFNNSGLRSMILAIWARALLSSSSMVLNSSSTVALDAVKEKNDK